MRWWYLLFVTGCGFHVAGNGADPPGTDAAGDGIVIGDGTPGDGSATDGSTTDSPMVSACTIQETGNSSTIATLGGGGGTRTGALACADNGLPIGLAFDVTPNPIAAHQNQTLMANVKLRCGVIARTTSGVMLTSGAELVTYVGLMGSTPTACDLYKPPVATSEVLCPGGQAMVGLVGNKVDPTSLYNSVGIVCASLALDGSVTPTTQMLAIPGTGTYTNQPQATSCPAGQAIVSFSTRSGCGQDGLIPSCAALSCQ